MKIGVIGGSGLYEMDGLSNVKPRAIATPFGPPSDEYVGGEMGGHEVFFLPRHGRGHRLLPSEINHRANIFGFKTLGVERIISISAVGSLREELRPRDIVLPDQYFDRTKKSAEHTFFGQGIVAHAPFGEPACPDLRRQAAAACRQTILRQKQDGVIRVHAGGTYVSMEGPAFSTKAESLFYRKMGFDVIGMTSLGEAKLCREAGICYQLLAMVTDFDCWHESEQPVTVEIIITNLTANSTLAKEVVRELVGQLSARPQCGCAGAMSSAVLTAPAAMPAERKKMLEPLLRKYVGDA
jgi:5'-methylthioadenosine phosphorylase